MSSGFLHNIAVYHTVPVKNASFKLHKTVLPVRTKHLWYSIFNICRYCFQKHFVPDAGATASSQYNGIFHCPSKHNIHGFLPLYAGTGRWYSRCARRCRRLEALKVPVRPARFVLQFWYLMTSPSGQLCAISSPIAGMSVPCIIPASWSYFHFCKACCNAPLYRVFKFSA